MLQPRRILSAGVLALILVLSLVTLALAHAEFVSAVPAPNSAVASAPGVVTATYSEAIDPKGAALTVTGPNGARVDNGDGHVDQNNPDRTTMVVTLKSGLSNGKYTVHWTTLALDGDSLTDTFVFSVGRVPVAPANPASGAAPALPKTGGTPAGLLAVGGLALTVAGVGMRRREG